MTRIIKSLKTRFTSVVEPQGKNDLQDRMALMLWEGYAIIRGMMCYFADKSSRTATLPSIEKGASHIRRPYNRDFFRSHISKQILPFWERHSIDHAYGGFITHLNRFGMVFGNGIKLSPMQGRMIYAFSVGYDILGDSRYLELAKHGFDFLLEKFWDDTFGGWYRSVFRDGRAKDTDKHTIDQAFVLIGLVKYYRITRDETAKEYITKTYEVLEQKVWDEQYLGYYERCARDWSPVSNKKTICSQLDVLTAIVHLYDLEQQEIFRDKLEQVASLIVSRMYDKKYCCVLETFHRDWRYNPRVSMDKIQFGHNLKAALLLLEICRLTGNLSYFEYAKRLVDYCLRHGWDRRHRGFYQHASRSGFLATSEKLWWPECEGMVALLLVYSVTSNEVYFDYFQELADFWFMHFVDHENGECFTACRADGNVKDDRKGYDWKAAYHTVNACAYAHRFLE